MDDLTSLLGLGGFTVIGVGCVDGEPVRVEIETCLKMWACPECGVVSSRIKDRPRCRVRDLPAFGRPVQLWWRKRRLVCRESLCPRRSFTEVTAAVRPRGRLTERLRAKLADAVCSSNRSVTDVCGEYGVSWHTTQAALVERATRLLGEPMPTRMLGIDETRTRRVRWVLAQAGWKRTNPWMTSFVDADPNRPGRLLGLAPGRSGSAVTSWLDAQSDQFRDRVEIVVIDPFRPYASGVRKALPHAQLAVDKWHVIKLGNDTVDEVRKRLSKSRHGRRGTTNDPVWKHRNLLLTGADRLTDRQQARLERVLAEGDPTGELRAAWQGKELLRNLAHTPADQPDQIRRRLWSFYTACADADMPETTTLATTVEEWWPAIHTAITTRLTNARTEGLNRIVKQVKRAACGFRNMDNYQLRVRLTIAANRQHKQTA
jgi:transposase